MSEWQPVRIAPFDGREHVNPDTIYRIAGTKGGYEKTHIDVIGKVIRVRQTEHIYSRYVCGAEFFVEVHPDDARDVLGLLIPGAKSVMCEHQIQAD